LNGIKKINKNIIDKEINIKNNPKNCEKNKIIIKDNKINNLINKIFIFKFLEKKYIENYITTKGNSNIFNQKTYIKIENIFVLEIENIKKDIYMEIINNKKIESIYDIKRELFLKINKKKFICDSSVVGEENLVEFFDTKLTKRIANNFSNKYNKKKLMKLKKIKEAKPSNKNISTNFFDYYDQVKKLNHLSQIQKTIYFTNIYQIYFNNHIFIVYNLKFRNYVKINDYRYNIDSEKERYLHYVFNNCKISETIILQTKFDASRTKSCQNLHYDCPFNKQQESLYKSKSEEILDGLNDFDDKFDYYKQEMRGETFYDDYDNGNGDNDTSNSHTNNENENFVNNNILYNYNISETRINSGINNNYNALQGNLRNNRNYRNNINLILLQEQIIESNNIDILEYIRIDSLKKVNCILKNISNFFQRLIRISSGLFLYMKNKILNIFKHSNDSKNIYLGNFINKLSYFIQVIKDKNKISTSSKDEVREKNVDSFETINLTKKEISSFCEDEIIGKNIDKIININLTRYKYYCPEMREFITFCIKTNHNSSNFIYKYNKIKFQFHLIFFHKGEKNVCIVFLFDCKILLYEKIRKIFDNLEFSLSINICRYTFIKYARYSFINKFK